MCVGLKDWEKRLIISDRAHIGESSQVRPGTLFLCVNVWMDACKNVCVCGEVCEPCFLWGVWECVSPLSLLRSVWLPPSGWWRSGTAETRASRQEVRNLLLKNGCSTHTHTHHVHKQRSDQSEKDGDSFFWTYHESYESLPTPSRTLNGVLNKTLSHDQLFSPFINKN